MATAGTFDLSAEVIEVPAVCAPLQGWYAMTERAAREMVTADIERDRRCKSDTAAAKTAEAIAVAQRDAAVKEVKTNAFWSRLGPILIVVVGGVASMAGFAGGFAFGARK